MNDSIKNPIEIPINKQVSAYLQQISHKDMADLSRFADNRLDRLRDTLGTDNVFRHLEASDQVQEAFKTVLNGLYGLPHGRVPAPNELRSHTDFLNFIFRIIVEQVEMLRFSEEANHHQNIMDYEQDQESRSKAHLQ